MFGVFLLRYVEFRARIGRVRGAALLKGFANLEQLLGIQIFRAGKRGERCGTAPFRDLETVNNAVFKRSEEEKRGT